MQMKKLLVSFAAWMYGSACDNELKRQGMSIVGTDRKLAIPIHVNFSRAIMVHFSFTGISSVNDMTVLDQE